MEQIRLDHQLPVKKQITPQKGTSSSGKSVISGTNPTIWDMRDSRRHWCLIYCKKHSFPPVCPVSACSDCIPRHSPQWLFQS